MDERDFYIIKGHSLSWRKVTGRVVAKLLFLACYLRTFQRHQASLSSSAIAFKIFSALTHSINFNLFCDVALLVDYEIAQAKGTHSHLSCDKMLEMLEKHFRFERKAEFFFCRCQQKRNTLLVENDGKMLQDFVLVKIDVHCYPPSHPLA